MKKNNSLKIAAIVLAVVMVASVALFFVTKGSSGKQVTETSETTVYSYETSAYTLKTTAVGTDGRIYLPTDEPGLYYTATLKNEVDFWVYQNGSFTAAPYEEKIVTVYLYATYEKIPVKLTYIDGPSFTIGYGVFTSDMDSSVDVYEYAFAKIAKAPSDYESKSGYLLLADFDKDNFYKEDKVYSEIYKFNMNSPNLNTTLSNNTRLIDENGSFRQDWSMLTDEFLSDIGSANYFMSSRYYSASETGKRTDIMAYSSAYRPTIIAEDIVGDWFVSNSNGYYYIKSTDTGFESVLVKDDKTTSLQKFEGSYFDDYLRDEQYLLNKKTGVVTDLMGGGQYEITGLDLTGATVFEINSDRTKAVVAFSAVSNSIGTPVQTVAYCTFGGENEVYNEPLLYSEESSFIWVDSDAVMSVRPLDGTGSTCGSVIYNCEEK